MKLDKLEYVEISYFHNGKGESIVCHYASGKTIKHAYVEHKSFTYAMFSSRFKTLYFCLIPRYTLDNSHHIVFGANNDS